MLLLSILSSFVSPLLPLGLGLLLVRGYVRRLMYCRIGLLRSFWYSWYCCFSLFIVTGELHRLQHFHQFGALFLHDSSGYGGCIRDYHHLTAICWVCCGVFSVGGLGRGSGLVLIHLTTAVLRLRFHGFSTNDCRGSGPR